MALRDKDEIGTSGPRLMPQGIAGRFRNSLLVVGVLMAAVVASFWTLCLHPFDLLVGIQRDGTNDLTSWYLPRREYPKLTLTQFGQLPFWNPWVAGGAPFFGSFQTAVFYPPNWVFWVLPARTLISWNLVVHHLVAATGAYLLSRRLGAASLGAAFAAVAFGFSPILIARTGEGHLTIINAVAWYPWAFMAYDGLRAGKSWSAITSVTTLALCFLAGHPQEFYYLILALSTLCVADAVGLLVRGRSKEGLRLGVLWGLVGLVSAGLVAAELIPLSIYLRNASSQARLQSAMPVSPGLENLNQIIFPFASGGPAFYWGSGSYFWETICYFGLIPAGLALLGAVKSLRPGRPVWRIAIVGIVSFALGFGESTPLHGMFAASIPGYASLRCPGRWFLMSALAVAVLGGFGIDDLIRERSRERGQRSRNILLVLASIAAMSLLALRVTSLAVETQGRGGLRSVPDYGRISEWYYLAPLLAFVIGLGWVWLSLLIPSRSRAFIAMLLLTAIVELSVFSNAILTTIPPESYPRVNPLPKLIAERKAGTRLFSTQFAFTDDESFRSESPKFQGYEPLPLDRTIRFTSVMLNPEYPLSNLEGFYKLEMKKASPPLLDLWGARHFVAMNRDELPSNATDWNMLQEYRVATATTPRGQSPKSFSCRLWENPGAIPRGFVVGHVRTRSATETDAEALLQLKPREEVLLERDVLPAGTRQDFLPARRVDDTPNRVVLEVETTYPGYLVLTDAWYPGWSATLDGQPTPILQADLAFRAVALPEPGRHRVIFRYFPPGLIAGLLISAASAAGLALYTARLIRSRSIGQSGVGPLSDPSMLARH